MTMQTLLENEKRSKKFLNTTQRANPGRETTPAVQKKDKDGLAVLVLNQSITHAAGWGGRIGLLHSGMNGKRPHLPNWKVTPAIALR
jgi:hypothetical protein